MPVQFSDATRKKLDSVIARYPNSQAACLPALHLAQAEFGHLSDEVMQLVAEYLKIPYAHVFGVVTFYTMFHRKPVGKNVIMVCTNVSCMLRGAYGVLEHLERKLGIKAGETTADRRFTLLCVECLASCGTAPTMQVNDTYHEELSEAKIDLILEGLA